MGFFTNLLSLEALKGCFFCEMQPSFPEAAQTDRQRTGWRQELTSQMNEVKPEARSSAEHPSTVPPGMSIPNPALPSHPLMQKLGMGARFEALLWAVCLKETEQLAASCKTDLCAHQQCGGHPRACLLCHFALRPVGV